MIRRPSFPFALVGSCVLALGTLLMPGVAAADSATMPTRTVAAAVANTATTPPPAPPVTDNVFLPQSQDIGTCIGTLERPGCGSKAKGDFRQYLTFLALILGMAFIGWRITIGIKQRDRNHTKPTGNTF